LPLVPFHLLPSTFQISASAAASSDDDQAKHDSVHG
jgi:hypothetical protein